MRLNEAIEIDPERTEATWCIGNAYTSLVRAASDLYSFRGAWGGTRPTQLCNGSSLAVEQL